MSCLSLEEKRVSGESERREMLCNWGVRWGGDFKEQPRCHVVQHLRGEGENEVHFHKHSRSSHELPPSPGKNVSLLKTHMNLLCPIGLSGLPGSWAE